LDDRAQTLRIQDDIVASGAHEIAVCFHLAEDARLSPERRNRSRIAVAGGTVTLELDARLTVEILAGSDDPIGGWVSRRYHRKVPSTTLMARGRCEGKSSYVSRIDIEPAP
jgi:hypothetical protein